LETTSESKQAIAREGVTRHLTLAAVGALVVLFGYLLPFFPQRITRATTLYTDGSSVNAEFSVLIADQKYIQSKPPLEEELDRVTLSVERLSWLRGSGWGWLVSAIASGDDLSSHLGFVLWMLLPLVGSGYVLGMAWGHLRAEQAPLRQSLATAINLSLVSLLGMVLAWALQFDFSVLLLRLAGPAMVPGVGCWLALVGVVSTCTAAWGLYKGNEQSVFTWWALVFVVTLFAWLLTRVQPNPYLEIWRFVSDGILTTLRIVITSFVFILFVSLLGGLGRVSHSPLIRGIASLYVEIIRGIPLLVQLLFIWYALPQVMDWIGELLLAISPSLSETSEWFISLRLDPFMAAVIGFTICYGAYGSEVFRAGISSIHRGQIEAARSLGMSPLQAMRYVVLPQAIRVILPPIGNEFVSLLKDSTLVSVLAVPDLTRRGREYMSRTFLSLDTWTMVALCYLVMTLLSSRVVEYIEARTKFEH